MDGISDYMGPVFEEICTEYLWRQAKNHALPFIPAAIGKWWGTNPIRKQQDDIDILALDKTGKEGLFCECKFRNRPMPMEEYDDLVQAAAAFPNVTQKHFCFFSKGGYTHPVIDRANREGARLLGIKSYLKYNSKVISETLSPLAPLDPGQIPVIADGKETDTNGHGKANDGRHISRLAQGI